MECADLHARLDRVGRKHERMLAHARYAARQHVPPACARRARELARQLRGARAWHGALARGARTRVRMAHMLPETLARVRACTRPSMDARYAVCTRARARAHTHTHAHTSRTTARARTGNSARHPPSPLRLHAE